MVNNETALGIATKHSSIFKRKAETRQLSKAVSYIANMNDNGLFDRYINLLEDKQTAAENAGLPHKGHSNKRSTKCTILQKRWVAGRILTTAARRLPWQLQQRSTKRVRHQAEDTRVLGLRKANHDHL